MMEYDTREIIEEYMRVVNDFARKLDAIDKKHGTYVHLEVIDREARVDCIGQPIGATKRARQIYVHDMVLNGVPEGV